MGKLINEFRRGWQVISQPSATFCIGFCTACLLLATLARWGLAQIRPDVFFTPYFPAVFFATAVCGLRYGILTALVGGVLGVTVNFSSATADSARAVLLVIFWLVAALTIWGVTHYRDMVSQQHEVSQHRLKNKLSTIHAVLHQVLDSQPQVWSVIDHRLRALAATDDLISRVDGIGCDIRDLLLSELGPYGHVRFTLNGDPLFLPAKLAVSLALVFHELATNAGKYGAFSSPRGLLQVSWTRSEDRLNITWDETEGPAVEKVGAAGFGTRLLKSALTPFDGKTEVAYLKTGVHCTMQCRIPKS
jgi:two-component sensor histidine kinase